MESRKLALLTDEAGAPIKAELLMRESTSAHGRIKVTLAAPVENGLAVLDPEGELHPSKLPDTEATMAALCPEFRLEMN
jgi:hypothetical protein